MVTLRKRRSMRGSSGGLFPGLRKAVPLRSLLLRKRRLTTTLSGGLCRSRRGLGQEVWRGSRGVAFEVGVGLALHEGHFRWGFHRIPYSGEPVPLAPALEGGHFVAPL